ncbi:MAG: iron-sulfur cluster insertion protein ErpA [Pseudomonadota bacterium]
MTTATNSNDSVKVSANAAKRIAKIVANENNDALKLRLSVSGGGCSGFQYGFELDDKEEDGDIVIKRDNATVVIDGMSLLYLTGSELDYVEDLTGSYFRVNNPNAQSSCGCGTSFSI